MLKKTLKLNRRYFIFGLFSIYLGIISPILSKDKNISNKDRFTKNKNASMYKWILINKDFE